MRTLFTLFIVMGLVSPLCAQTTIIYEDFEGAAPGTLLNTLPGWSGPDDFVISDVTIDQGQSLDCGAGDTSWPRITKGISYTPSAGECYYFSGTLWVGSNLNDYAHAQLRTGGDARLWVGLGYNELVYQYDFGENVIGEEVRVPMVINEDQSVATMDFKLIIQGNSFDAYWRLNGESAWEKVGTCANGIDMDDFIYLDLYGNSPYPGRIDTISLVAGPPPAYYPGDATLDGKVDQDDAAKLAEFWLTQENATWEMGDFNEDYKVNDIDATIMAANWGYGVPQTPASVPEPGAITLIFLGGLTLLAAARKRCA